MQQKQLISITFPISVNKRQ